MEVIGVLAAKTGLHSDNIPLKRYADRNRPGSGSCFTCVVLGGHVGSSFIVFSRNKYNSLCIWKEKVF